MVRGFLLVGVRMLALLTSAISVSFDLTGTSLLGIKPDAFRNWAYISFAVFLGLTLWRDIEAFLRPHPNIIYDGVSYEKASAMKQETTDSWARRPAYFTKLSFKNKAKNPSGEESTAKSTTASVTIYDDKGKLIDSWEGRWANNSEPFDYPSKMIEDRLDVETNNQSAILDIGLRFEGDTEFYGWNNHQNLFGFGGFIRDKIKPNQYELQVTLSASNMKEKTWGFTLDVPNDPQGDKPNQVKIIQIKKLKFHKEGSQP